ncbi:hypothetical protein ACFEMC_09670 [Kineococcus sp. DHX-1]|uniref:hypothetical protein n=1 Tax=Kineococcus sp. DHX-1 TaxID=3349638 RepID=UPI0036D40BDE
MRLHRAHEDLLAADPAAGDTVAGDTVTGDTVTGDTVAAVAVRWGFTPGGRCAANYRLAFGVLPGQTPPR